VRRGEIVASYELRGAEHESVYAVCELSSTFADPDASRGVFGSTSEHVTT